MRKLILVALASSIVFAAPRYGIGRTPTAAEIRELDISVAPDGTGLPVGHGTGSDGAILFRALCATCHGAAAQGSNDYPALVGGIGTLAKSQPILTVGSYWPFATTLWDYVHRAMPYWSPGALTTNQVYALTAFILQANGVIAPGAVLDEKTLPRVRMPNRDGFIGDPRPDVR